MGNWGSAPSEPVQDGPTGPYHNPYWRRRRNDPEWQLREALLSGDTQAVCALLGIKIDEPDLLSRLATPLSKRNQTRTMKEEKALQDLVLTSHRWSDDCGQTAFHYLVCGRRFIPQGLETNFPIAGEGAKEGPSAEESASERMELVHLLVARGRLDPMGLLLKNEPKGERGGITALHLAAWAGSLSVLRPALAVLSADIVLPLVKTQSIENEGTALHYAVTVTDAEARMRVLGEVLELVAAPQRAELLGLKNREGQTALDEAVLWGHFDAARLLLARCQEHGALPFGNLAAIDSRVMQMIQRVGDGGLGGSGFSIGDRIRVKSTGKAGIVADASGRKLSVALDGSKPGSAATAVELADVEQLPERAGSSGWGWGMAAKVKVVSSDEERVGLVLAREKSLARRLGVEEGEASALLQQHAFQLDQAELHYRTTGGAAPAQAAPAEVQGPDCTCMVCFEEVSPAQREESIAVLRLACKHFTCDECLLGHARVRLEEGRLGLLVCPREACSAPVAGDALRDLFAAQEPAMLERHRVLLANSSVNESETAWWCPGLGCGRSIEMPADIASFSVAVTCECGERFCTACRQPPHEPAPCRAWDLFHQEVKAFLASGEAESEQWIRLNTTKCIFCRAPVNRSSGCNHMKCTQCSKEFCYACGDVWSSPHYGCARPEAPDNPIAAGAVVGGKEVTDRKALNRAFCIKAYQRWEKLQSDREEGWYGRECDHMGFTVAKEVLTKVHKTILMASRVMACSFAVDFSVPDSIRYARARKILRELRGALEAALFPAVALLQLRREHHSYARDRHTKLLLCYTVETSPDVARELATVALVIKKRAARLVSASRVGLMTYPVGHVESLGVALGDAAQQAQMTTARALRSISIVLGLAEAPKKRRVQPRA